MTGTHYFGSNPPSRDWDRIEMFAPFDVILCGKGTPDETVIRLQEYFPDKLIGEYLATVFELSEEEIKTYPGKMSNRTTGVGRVVGMMNDETVAWQAERAKANLGPASLFMADNSDPKQPIGDPRLYTVADVENWREFVPKTMAAIGNAIGEARLVANVGHSVNPMSTGNLALRECYSKFCASVNGIGIEKRTGSTIATYSPGSFMGPFLSPRISFAFAQDAQACEVTDGMLLPSYVVKSFVKHVVVQQWIEEGN